MITSSHFARAAGLALLLTVTTPAQRLLVTADDGTAAGTFLRTFDACSGAATGAPVLAGLAMPRSARGTPYGTVVVANAALHEVLEFDANGALVRVLVPSGSGGLHQPQGLAYGLDGRLYVTSTSPARVLTFDGTTGAPLGVFASLGAGEILKGLAFRTNGNLLVASAASNVVYELSGTSGGLVRTFAGGLSAPAGVAVGADGHVYVASTGNDAVVRFDASLGTSLGAFVGPGSGGLQAPLDLAVLPNGNLVVSTDGGGGIKEYDAETGAFAGTLVPGLSRPLGIAVQWPSRVLPYGNATPGCSGRPCIGANASPDLGTATFAVTGDRAPPNAAGALALGSARLGTPILVAGAELWIDPGAQFFLLPAGSNSQGRSSVTLPVPLDPALAGLHAYVQFGWPDACAPGGLAATRSLDLTLDAASPPPPPTCDPAAGFGEPNDVCSLATPLPVGPPIANVLCPAGDVDWYQFSIPGPRNVQVRLDPPTSPCLDYDVELHASCGSLLALSSNGGCATETLAMPNLPAGSYRLRVAGNAGAFHGTAPYTLQVTAVAAPQPTIQTITVPGPLTIAGPSYPIFHTHPTLQYVFTPAATENVIVSVSSPVFQMAPCLSPWMFARINVNNGGWTIASTSLQQGSSAVSLSGSFTAQANQTYAVIFLVGFNCASFGGANLAQVPPAGGTAVMTVTRQPL